MPLPRHRNGLGATTGFRYARLFGDKSDPDLARGQLDQATTLFRELEMTWWLEQAEALGKSLTIG